MDLGSRLVFIVGRISIREMLPVLVLGLVMPRAWAQDDPQLRPVVKSNGSVALYRLTPVTHHDPEHAFEVERRLAQEQAPTPLPTSYRIDHDKLPPVRDQGQRGTCAYFATLGLVETYYKNLPSGGASVHLSEECLVDVRDWMFDAASYTGDDKPTQRPDPNGDDPVSIIKTITRNGVPLNGDYGSSLANCDYGAWGTKPISLDTYNQIFTTAHAEPYAKGKVFDYNTAPTIDTIRTLISMDIPVEVGILVYNEDMSSDDWYGYYGSMDIAGGHAVQLVGYITYDDGSTRFIFKNSWGLDWGGSGYGRIDDRRLIHGWGYDPSLDFIASLHD